jgi:hypothetical protein
MMCVICVLSLIVVPLPRGENPFAVKYRYKKNAYMILVGKPEGQKPVERIGCGWEDNNKMNLEECGWSGVDWTHLAEDRGQWRALMNTIMKFRIPLNFGIFSFQ